MLVNFYSSLGYVVLTYDKRGVGASKGVYQEFPSDRNVENLAGDAIGAVRVLAARKDVDPSRVGLVGASQAGWIIPRAAARSPLVKLRRRRRGAGRLGRRAGPVRGSYRRRARTTRRRLRSTSSSLAPSRAASTRARTWRS